MVTSREDLPQTSKQKQDRDGSEVLQESSKSTTRGHPWATAARQEPPTRGPDWRHRHEQRRRPRGQSSGLHPCGGYCGDAAMTVTRPDAQKHRPPRRSIHRPPRTLPGPTQDLTAPQGTPAPPLPRDTPHGLLHAPPRTLPAPPWCPPTAAQGLPRPRPVLHAPWNTPTPPGHSPRAAENLHEHPRHVSGSPARLSMRPSQ